MEPEERARLEKLDAIVRSDELRAKIDPIVDRVCTALSQQAGGVDDLGADPAGHIRTEIATGNSIRLDFRFACRR